MRGGRVKAGSLRSETECELDERDTNPIMYWHVGGELVVAAAQVVHERMSGGDGLGGAHLFESAHRSKPRRQPAVIGLDAIVRVLLGDVPGGWLEVLSALT